MLGLVGEETTSTGTRNYTFSLKGNNKINQIIINLGVLVVPHNARLYIEPLEGVAMLSWSLERYVPHTTPYGDGRGCYYVLYTRGTGEQPTYFWIEVKVNIIVGMVLTHYVLLITSTVY